MNAERVMSEDFQNNINIIVNDIVDVIEETEEVIEDINNDGNEFAHEAPFYEKHPLKNKEID